jgi:hypothetical protein
VLLQVGNKLIAVRLHHLSEALNGAEDIGMPGGQLLRSNLRSAAIP